MISRLAVALLILFLTLLPGLWIGVPMALHWWLEQGLPESLQGRAAAIRFNPLNFTLQIDALRVTRAQTELAGLESLRVQFDPIPLLTKRLQIELLEISRPRTLVPPEQFEWFALPPDWELAIRTARLSEAHLQAGDRKQDLLSLPKLTLQDLHQNGRSGTGRFRVHMIWNLSEAEANGSYRHRPEEVSVQADVESLDAPLDRFAVLLPPGTQVEGRLQAAGTLLARSQHRHWTLALADARLRMSALQASHPDTATRVRAEQVEIGSSRLTFRRGVQGVVDYDLDITTAAAGAVSVAARGNRLDADRLLVRQLTTKRPAAPADRETDDRGPAAWQIAKLQLDQCRLWRQRPGSVDTALESGTVGMMPETGTLITASHCTVKEAALADGHWHADRLQLQDFAIRLPLPAQAPPPLPWLFGWPQRLQASELLGTQAKGTRATGTWAIDQLLGSGTLHWMLPGDPSQSQAALGEWSIDRLRLGGLDSRVADAPAALHLVMANALIDSVQIEGDFAPFSSTPVYSLRGALQGFHPGRLADAVQAGVAAGRTIRRPSARPAQSPLSEPALTASNAEFRLAYQSGRLQGEWSDLGAQPVLPAGQPPAPLPSSTRTTYPVFEQHNTAQSWADWLTGLLGRMAASAREPSPRP